MESITNKKQSWENRRDKYVADCAALGNIFFLTSCKFKKYIKFDTNNLLKILKWNVSIPLKNYEKIKNSKITFLIYAFMLKYKKIKLFSKKTFIDFGFKKSSVNLALKKLCAANLITKTINGYKLNNNFWTKKKEQYFKLNSVFIWKMFFINSFQTFKAIFLFKMLIEKKVKKCNKKKIRIKKFYVSNNFLQLNKKASYVFLKNLSKLLFMEYTELFLVDKKYDKQKKSVYSKRILLTYYLNFNNLFC